MKPEMPVTEKILEELSNENINQAGTNVDKEASVLNPWSLVLSCLNVSHIKSENTTFLLQVGWINW